VEGHCSCSTEASHYQVVFPLSEVCGVLGITLCSDGSPTEDHCLAGHWYLAGGAFWAHTRGSWRARPSRHSRLGTIRRRSCNGFSSLAVPACSPLYSCPSVLLLPAGWQAQVLEVIFDNTSPVTTAIFRWSRYGSLRRKETPSLRFTRALETEFPYSSSISSLGLSLTSRACTESHRK